MTDDHSQVRDVYILGAGFSRALSPYLPLTDELGDRCLEQDELARAAAVPGGKFSPNTFETWLSRIAEAQPYQSAWQTLANQSLFLRFTEAMADILNAATESALKDGWRPWLPMFLRLAHHAKNDLITFNYDTLVECALQSHSVFKWQGTPSVSYESVLGNMPAPPPQLGMRFGLEITESFRLYKLHGSLNWHHVVGDATGISMAVGPLPGYFGAPQPLDRQVLRRLLPGRVPFIVPPASAKSSYLTNPVVRQLWQEALEAMTQADRVTFVGYSLPTGDQTFAGLLATAFAEHPANIAVADLDPEPVIRRLQNLGATNKVTETYSGLTAIADLVSARVDERSSQLVDSLRLAAAGGHAEHALAVSFDYTNTAAVVGIDFEPGTNRLVLISESLQDWTLASGARTTGDGAQPPLLKLLDIQQRLEQATTIQVRHGGSCYPLVHVEQIMAATGAADRWLMLSTAASLRGGVHTDN